MVDRLDKIWMDGALVDWDDATVHVLTHTLHYGLGAFEGIRAYRRADGRSAVFRLREHVDRLFDSAKLLLMPMPFTRERLCEASVELLRANRLEEGYLRPLAFMGAGDMGIAADNATRISIAAWRWGAYLGKDGVDQGIRAKISSFARHHVNASLPKAKVVGQYASSILAKREAKLGGYDEAILLDTSGHVTEGSGANVFIVRQGALVTPPLSSSILAGITRDTVMTLAREEGIPVIEASITRDELWLADEAFFTGTAAELTPIREVDDRAIGEGKPGPITKRLQARYFEVVRGSDDAHPEWYTTYGSP
jgi:branched-chain amino acid aminotransferase